MRKMSLKYTHRLTQSQPLPVALDFGILGIMKALLTLTLVIILTGCRGTHRSPASGDEERFARVYARLVMLSASAQADSRPSPARILSDEGMSEDQFRATVAEYNRDPRAWGPLIEKVQRLIEEETAAGNPGESQPDSTSPPGVRPPSR
jgi:hypothetical protein